MSLESMFQTSTEWELEKHYPKDEGCDGQDARVLVWKAPAKFYKIEGLPSTNSIGEPVLPFFLSTGSGEEVRDLAHRIANSSDWGCWPYDEEMEEL